MGRGRERADQLMVARGLADSRSRAQALIMAGELLAGDRPVDKPGTPLPADTPLRLRSAGPRWASRGAHKLLAGLDGFGIDPAGRVALDIGASTGGFTDVLLARGTARVHAVDVGQGELAWHLQQDSRVVVHDRTNARYLTPAQIGEAVDLLVCDASFISLTVILPAPLALLRPGGSLVALIKPQFEAGRADVGKGGVVRDAAVRARVCKMVGAWLADRGLHVQAPIPSPITGPKGNREYLIAAQKPAEAPAVASPAG